MEKALIFTSKDVFVSTGHYILKTAILLASGEYSRLRNHCKASESLKQFHKSKRAAKCYRKGGCSDASNVVYQNFFLILRIILSKMFCGQLVSIEMLI